MTRAGGTENLTDGFGAALEELGEQDGRLVVLDAAPSHRTGTRRFSEKFPDRYFAFEAMEPTMMSVGAGLALDGRVVFATAAASSAAGLAYSSVRQSVCGLRASVKIVAVQPGLLAAADRTADPMLEDIGLMRGLPGMTVVVPADAPTTRAATRALAARPGPAYLRLSSESRPTVTDGSFEVGRAVELRAGTDVTLVAIGSMVAPALSVADEFAQVGISVRVLDLASVKPFDAPAVLRAARDTGAILVLEEHSMLTGVGALIAQTTAENYPVPVRRVGVPDLLFEPPAGGAALDRYGLSPERIRDELWELLRMRGKVQ
jgi:transketolase